jgi:DNA-binding beta-propeller fold protein YncE
MNALAIVLCSGLFPVAAVEPAPQGTQAPAVKVRKIPVGGEGGWDYLTADPEGRRLYISRGDHVVVVDLDKETVVGELPETPGIHGIAVVPELGKGFTSNGRDSTVTMFDLKTLKATGKIKASGTPDAILYDPASSRVFTFNHGTNNLTAIDPSGGTVAGTIDLGGEPEAAVADGKGHLFINIRDKSEIVDFDAKALKVLKRYPLAPGTRPTGLAMDAAKRKLFSACGGNQKMVVMDADTGKVVNSLDIGRGCDGCVFDTSTGTAYSSNGGDGTLTAVKESEPGVYKVVATIPTQATARTIAIDPKTHRIYLPAATPMPAPAADPAAKAPAKGGRRGNVPGSFVVVIVGD